MSAPDRLDAVARVRRAREQDSLIGLQQARREADAALAVLDSLRARLMPDGVAGVDSMTAFLARRTAMLAVEQAATAAEQDYAAAGSIAESAQAHWAADRVRLEAIEMLQERRAEERRRERAAVEAKQLDEVATQSWARRDDQDEVAS